MYDPDRYRDKGEIEHWRERDPLTIAGQRLVASGVASDDDLKDIDTEVIAEVDAAVAFAEMGTHEDVAELTRFVTSEGATA